MAGRKRKLNPQNYVPPEWSSTSDSELDIPLSVPLHAKYVRYNHGHTALSDSSTTEERNAVSPTSILSEEHDVPCVPLNTETHSEDDPALIEDEEGIGTNASEDDEAMVEDEEGIETNASENDEAMVEGENASPDEDNVQIIGESEEEQEEEFELGGNLYII